MAAFLVPVLMRRDVYLIFQIRLKEKNSRSPKEIFHFHSFIF